MKEKGCVRGNGTNGTMLDNGTACPVTRKNDTEFMKEKVKYSTCLYIRLQESVYKILKLMSHALGLM